MKKMVLILFFVFSFSTTYAIVYPEGGGYYNGYINNFDGSSLTTGDQVKISFTVNYQVDRIPSYAKIGFVSYDTQFEENFSYYLGIGTDETTANNIIKNKITLKDNSNTNQLADAISEKFKMFYAIFRPSDVSLRIYLSSPDGSGSSLVGKEYKQKMEWSLSIDNGSINEIVRSDGESSYPIDFATDALHACDNYILEASVSDYSSYTVDVYEGYICLEVSSK